MNRREQKKLAEKEALEFIDRHYIKMSLVAFLLMLAGLYLHYNGYEKEIAGLIGLGILAFVFFLAYLFFKLLMWPISEDWP